MCKRANFNMYRVVVSAYLYIFENSWPNRILYVCLYFRWRCIAKLFRACFPGVSHRYRAICCKMGYRTGMSVQNGAPRGGIASCWGIAGMAEKVSRDRGYRSDTIAISRDMGPLSFRRRVSRKCRKGPQGPEKSRMCVNQSQCSGTFSTLF